MSNSFIQANDPLLEKPMTQLNLFLDPEIPVEEMA
jgi:hypothetical protein